MFDFLENMEDFVTLDELAEDEDEVGGRSDTIGTRSFHVHVSNSDFNCVLNVLKH